MAETYIFYGEVTRELLANAVKEGLTIEQSTDTFFKASCSRKKAFSFAFSTPQIFHWSSITYKPVKEVDTNQEWTLSCT